MRMSLWVNVCGRVTISCTVKYYQHRRKYTHASTNQSLDWSWKSGKPNRIHGREWRRGKHEIPSIYQQSILKHWKALVRALCVCVCERRESPLILIRNRISGLFRFGMEENVEGDTFLPSSCSSKDFSVSLSLSLIVHICFVTLEYLEQ